jgi:hypothetical protein
MRQLQAKCCMLCGIYFWAGSFSKGPCRQPKLDHMVSFFRVKTWRVSAS